MALLLYSFALALLSVQASIVKTDLPCEEITKFLVLDGNYSSIMGKWITAEGVSEGMVGMIIQMMETHWMEILPNLKNDTVIVRQAFSIDKTCNFGYMELHLQNNTVYEPGSDRIIPFYLLPSCSNCLTGYYNHPNRDNPERVLLLFSRERTVSESTRYLYQKQVKCLGFPGPFTVYNEGSAELCPMDTDIQMQN
ncbi:hypothetical protein AMELA_G00010020 [Ameiurus melas]|uniref:Apolipoprotein M n=1 Tax=Ameiurus melas TaxID=219545 RepID=A0A7J6BH34_AMEME|nr:hypothetical protein AMELA_G00010020 [Ameiurus melas]